MADTGRVIAYLSLRSAVLEGVPEGWERQDLDPALDVDALSWLGFEHGEPDEPLLHIPRPQRWPDIALRTGGRHRAPRRFASA
jgi:hypothetical protein